MNRTTPTCRLPFFKRGALPLLGALLALGLLAACQHPPAATDHSSADKVATQPLAADQTRFVFAVKGMTCRGCADGLQSELARLSGVVQAQVDLASARAQIIGQKDRLTSDQLAAAIREAGFQPTEIR